MLKFSDVYNFLDADTIDTLKKIEPAISQIYENNPYALTKIYDREKAIGTKELSVNEIEPIVSFIDIDPYIVLDTFERRKQQMKAAIEFCLRRNEKEGHTWINIDELDKNVKTLLKQTKHPLLRGDIYPYLKYYKNDFFISKDKKRTGFLNTYTREKMIYTTIKRALHTSSPFPNFEPVDVTNILSEAQLRASKMSVVNNNNISLLVGGPGTGKTTVIKTIVNGMLQTYPDVKMVLLAPTGKATNRIKEVFSEFEDLEINTIHKFIKYKNYLELSDRKRIAATDLIIIDESSMVDLTVFSDLLSLINIENTRVILVGDENQLPAVGAGDILNDCIKYGLHTEKLNINYRSLSDINKNATAINEGIPFFEESTSFKIIDCPKAFLPYILSHRFHTESKLLSPFREKGEGSVSNLNEHYQTRRFGNYHPLEGNFNINDVIIFTHTNYIHKYFNGDTGTIIGVDTNGDNGGEFIIKLDSGEIVTCDNTEDIELGYAITIHKSQGSEYPEIDICIPEYSPFITRKMLYTAVTRAKHKVRIWTTLEIFKKIVIQQEKTRRTMRNAGLSFFMYISM